MSKFANASIETADMQHREVLETRPQDQYARRRKFQFCPECGSKDSMQAVHRDTLTEMWTPAALAWIKSQQLWWYREPGNEEYLFYPCSECNRERIIPDELEAICDILTWFNRDPTASDYEALAAEEPRSR